MRKKQKSVICKVDALQKRADNFNKRACEEIDDGADNCNRNRNRKQDNKASEKVLFHILFVPQLQVNTQGNLLGCIEQHGTVNSIID